MIHSNLRDRRAPTVVLELSVVWLLRTQVLQSCFRFESDVECITRSEAF